MTKTTTEKFTSKVIVRFRHRAGKNGQLFPHTSWLSGFLIITSSRLILASGPSHHFIPYSEILSIESDGKFPLEDGPRQKLVPISFGSGMDVYLSLIGVPPILKNILTKKLYVSILSSFKSTYLLKEDKEIPISFRLSGGELRIDPAGMGPIYLGLKHIQAMKASKEVDGYRMSIPIESGDHVELSLKGQAGVWAMKMMDHFMKVKEPPMMDKHRKVLELLSDTPMTTTEITKELHLVQMEASTIINEMIFLELVGMDHATKHYMITPKGRAVLSGSSVFFGTGN